MTKLAAVTIVYRRLHFLLLPLVATAVLGDDRLDQGANPKAVEPRIEMAFTPLAPGAIEPKGWLRDWAMAARDGITGHLDERHPVFEHG
jgi:hypothetical protein